MIELNRIGCRVRYARYLKQQLDQITPQMAETDSALAHTIVGWIYEGLTDGHIEVTDDRHTQIAHHRTAETVEPVITADAVETAPDLRPDFSSIVQQTSQPERKVPELFV